MEDIEENEYHIPILNGSLFNQSIINISLSDTISDHEELQLEVLIPMTIIYLIIFFTGLIGNVSTCIVISRNKSMHTATNYYLFSLAMSDLLLLIAGVPFEIDHMWSPYLYIWGNNSCFLKSFAAETSVNASVLTITAFTVERYVAICHPFLSHTMSKLSRAVKFIFFIWLFSLALALPQTLPFGVQEIKYENGVLVESRCTITKVLIPHIFVISTFVIFVIPMTIITCLYLLIGLKLRRSRIITLKNPQQVKKSTKPSTASTQLMQTGAILNGSVRTTSVANSQRNSSKAKQQAQNRVIKMLGKLTYS